MPAPGPRLVYYSLLAGPAAATATRQLLGSVASLRAHNGRIPVRLFVFGALDEAARGELVAHGVTVVEAGDYEASLSRFCPPRVAETLARSPVLHYALCLSLLDAPPETQLLYVDGDTVFFGDVEALFARYGDRDLHAREEPYSRRSHLGHDAGLVDEDALAGLAAGLGAGPVPPFNNGVMLWNRGAWRALAARLGELFALVFRFTVGIARGAGGERHRDLAYLREHRARLVTAEDEAAALPCPTRNVWIKDEVALWLTLGTVPGLTVGLLSRHDVLQGAEFERVELVTPVVLHYFTVNMRRFEAWSARRAAGPSLAAGARPSSATMMPAFAALGSRIEDAWQRLDYDELAFSALATAALREARIDRELTGLDVARWVLGAPELPQQDDLGARFGDPPVTVYRGRRFYVQALFWREGKTSIHRHGFSGAFQVLDGSSLHVRYAFDARRRVSSHLLLGELTTTSVELLGRGDIVEVPRALLHTVFHLEAPATTLVVRTFREEEGQPQYDYRPPSLAHDPFYNEPHATRQVQVLRLLWGTGRPEADELAADLVARSDLHTSWLVLEEAHRTLGSAARLASLLGAARRRHGAAIDELAAVLHEDLRRRRLGRLRGSVTDPGQRLFLALLQNVPHRAGIEAIVRARYPGEEPRARILAWLEALSGVDTLGVDLADELNLQLVRALLDGRSHAGVLEALAEIFEPAEVAAQAEALAAHVQRLRGTVLAPLFR